MTDKITNEDLAPLLAQEVPEFQALTKRFDPKCWARYDLSAMRIGYHYGREPLLARIAELEAQIKAAQEQQPVAAQHRFRSPQKTRPNWSVWQPCAVANRPPWEIDSQGYEVEYRNLYAAPVPAPSVKENEG